MAKVTWKNGQTSITLRVCIPDLTSVAGDGKTGLTFASSGLIIATIADNEASATAYTAAGGTIETIATLGTFAAPTATKCRFREVDSANLPGVYEIQIADARWAVSGARSLIVSIPRSTALGTGKVYAEIQLTATDPQDSVRGGLTALPNANAEAAGGLYTRGTGVGQIAQDANGRIDANQKAILGTTLTETVTGYLAAAFKKLYDVAAPLFTAASVNQTGDSYARLGSPIGPSISADIAEIEAETDGIASIPTNPLLTNDTRLNYVDAAISSRSTLTAAQVWANATRTLSTYNAIVDALWDELLSDHVVTGSMGATLALLSQGVEVTLVNPVSVTREVPELYQGSDYYASEGNALVWQFPTSPSLVGASAVFKTAGQSVTAIVDSALNKITVEIPRAKTTAMLLGRDVYGLTVTFANGHKSIRVSGRIVILPDPD